MKRSVLATLLLLAPMPGWSQSGTIASDFEIASVRRQLEREKSPLRQIAGRLNLGDLFLSRSESAAAREEYQSARSLAMTMRQKTRLESDMSGYATATGYAGLAEAKLGNDGQSFEAMEESVRFAGDSPKTWNLYASAMTILDRPRKAIAAARNAVAIAERAQELAPSPSNTLDTNIYRYALASALLKTDRLSSEAASLLEKLISSLAGETFQGVRLEVQQEEKFEVLSTTDSDAGSYLSVLNRSRLRLAKLYEDRGDLDQARALYQSVLVERSDDSAALSGLARLETANRSESFADAFEANPFSIELIEQYEAFLSESPSPSAPATGPTGETPGALMRRALRSLSMNRHDEVQALLDSLGSRFPRNDVISYLRARSYFASGQTAAANQIRQQLASSPHLLSRLSRAMDRPSVTPAFLNETGAREVLDPLETDLLATIDLLSRQKLSELQRQHLDAMSFQSLARVDAVGVSNGQSTFGRGFIGGIPFTFMAPVTFQLSLSAGEPVRLTYRILGVTRLENVNGLLVEPVRIARP